MKIRHRIILTALLMAAISACSTTAVREHPRLTAELSKVHRVVVIPPSVTVEKIMFTGENERMTDKEVALAPKMMKLGSSALSEHGYQVIPFNFDNATKDDPDFAFQLSQLRDAYLQAHKKLYKQLLVPTSKKQDIAATTGATANLIADRTGADALLLIDYKGYVKSGGEMAKEAAASVLLAVVTLGNAVVIPVSGQSQVEAAMIDGNTGDVLWSNIQGGAGTEGAAASVTFKSIPRAAATVADNKTAPAGANAGAPAPAAAGADRNHDPADSATTSGDATAAGTAPASDHTDSATSPSP